MNRIERFRSWTSRNPWRGGLLVGVTTGVILGVASAVAGLPIGVVAVFLVAGAAIGTPLAYAVLQSGNHVAPEFRDLSPADQATVGRALRYRVDQAEVPADPRLRGIAVRLLRRSLTTVRWAQPVLVGIAVVLIAFNAYLAVHGSWADHLGMLTIPLLFLAFGLPEKRRRLRLIAKLEGDQAGHDATTDGRGRAGGSAA